ncbi:MAG: hypothetical protein ACREM1_12535 [Longimicrobiales bacterium]
MQDWTGYNRGHREQALAELEAELAEFSHDGLVQLREDLRAHRVARGSWSGCVISYRRGAAGSVRRDRLGRARNAFTVLWDNGWLTDEEVTRLAESELQRRVRRRSKRRAPGATEPTAPAPLAS